MSRWRWSEPLDAGSNRVKMNEHEQNEPDDPQLPVELADQLKALYGQPLFVPPRTDELVLAKAREHLRHPGRSRRISRFPRWLAAAATVALCAWLGSSWLPSRRPKFAAREDLNHDGRVDILDAFVLARRLAEGSASSPLCDINGDGAVDQKDIDAIAARAVKLDKGGG